MRRRLVLWLLLAPALALRASGQQGELLFPPKADANLNPQAAFVARLLAQGASTYVRLPAGALPSHDARGAWRPAPLAAALGAQGPLVFRGDGAQAAAGLAVRIRRAPPDGAGRWLVEQGLPRVVLVENSSSVSPLSTGLAAWHWPYTVRSFAQVEADPSGVLDPARADLVVISAPGWWRDFANPPGGPSRMGAKVVAALRAYVRGGGAAVFIDVSQWDLEKAWPRTLDLAPLGPYAVTRLRLSDGAWGGLSLAPEGVAPDKLRRASAFTLIGDPHFEYPDGRRRPLAAAYAMPDPGGGLGWVAGLSFHVFDQQESLEAASRRLLLNMLLLAGNRRLSTQGEPKVPTPTPAGPSPIATVSATPTVGSTVRPSPEPSPSATPLSPSPTERPTAAATPSPTSTMVPPTPRPSPTPSPWPTRVPTLAPPRLPTPWPTAAPTLPPRPWPTVAVTLPPPLPTLEPTPLPTAAEITPGPTRVAWARPPVPLPAIPTAQPSPTPLPLAQPWPTLAPTPWPTLAPTARPRWIRPPALPTPVPTVRPWLRPRQRHSTLLPTAGLVVHYSRSRRVRPTATPVGQQAAVLLARPTVALTAGPPNALGCLSSAPEPFTDEGVFLRFCLVKPAAVRCVVYGPKGTALWRSPERVYGAGQQQVFFGGVAQGVDLSPGAYLFEVQARYADGRREARQGTLTKVRRRSQD